MLYSFALIYLTETIKEALDQGKYGCGIFVDLKKAFDSVDNKSLMSKSKHYNVKGVAYSWFEWYLKGRKQCVSINGFSTFSWCSSMICSWTIIISSLHHHHHHHYHYHILFFFFDLYTAIKFCKVHHFVCWWFFCI